MLARALLPALLLLLATSATRADDAEGPQIFDGHVTSRTFPDAPSYKQIVLRGDAARFLYEAMRSAPESSVERADGSTFLVRHAVGMTCSRSDRFSTPHFACLSFLAADGTMPLGTLDPEYGATARISVGN